MFQTFWLAGSKLSKLHSGAQSAANVPNASFAIHILQAICQVKSVTWLQNALLAASGSQLIVLVWSP